MGEIAIPLCCCIGAPPTPMWNSSVSPPLVEKTLSFFRSEIETSLRLPASVLDKARISSLLTQSSTNGVESVLRNSSVFLQLRPNNGATLLWGTDIFWLLLRELSWMD